MKPAEIPATLQNLIRPLPAPLGLLGLYFAGFQILAGALNLPPGVNAAFAARISPLLAGAFFISLLVRRPAAPGAGMQQRRPTPAPIRPLSSLLLIPLTPVAQYLIANVQQLPLTASLQVLLGAGLLIGLLGFGLPRVLARFSAPVPLMAVGLAFTYLVFAMAGLSAELTWFEQGDFVIQVGLLAAAVLFFHALLQPSARAWVLPGAMAFFLVNSGWHAWQHSQRALPLETAPAAPAPLFALTAGRTPRLTPSIYLLVYDAYVVEETLAGYGLSNRDQEAWLSEQGFELFPHTYSIGAYTLASMTTLLNATPDYRSGDREAVSGNSQVHQALRASGYTTYGLFSSDYYFIGSGSHYDVAYPVTRVRTPAETLARSVLLGEFRFDLDFYSLDYADFLNARQVALGPGDDRPRFVYAHSPFPGHTQNSGVCQADETEQFASRLATANQEMRTDVAAILAGDPGAIIVIAGDHGPYLTKNCHETGGIYSRSEISRLDIQDRFGTFLAIRAPLADCELSGTIMVLQDLFPALFVCLYQEPGLLDTRIEPTIRYSPSIISRVLVREGLIDGGIHDGQPLFESPP